METTEKEIYTSKDEGRDKKWTWGLFICTILLVLFFSVCSTTLQKHYIVILLTIFNCVSYLFLAFFTLSKKPKTPHSWKLIRKTMTYITIFECVILLAASEITEIILA